MGACGLYLRGGAKGTKRKSELQPRKTTRGGKKEKKMKLKSDEREDVRGCRYIL